MPYNTGKAFYSVGIRLITVLQTEVTDKLITFTCILGENYSFSVTGISGNFLVGRGDFSVSKWEFLVALVVTLL